MNIVRDCCLLQGNCCRTTWNDIEIRIEILWILVVFIVNILTNDWDAAVFVVVVAAAATVVVTVAVATSTSDAQRKHQSSTSLAFVRGIHRWPVNSPHKGPVTRKMFPFDDVIMMDEFHDVTYFVFPLKVQVDNVEIDMRWGYQRHNVNMPWCSYISLPCDWNLFFFALINYCGLVTSYGVIDLSQHRFR